MTILEKFLDWNFGYEWMSISSVYDANFIGIMRMEYKLQISGKWVGWTFLYCLAAWPHGLMKEWWKSMDGPCKGLAGSLNFCSWFALSGYLRML